MASGQVRRRAGGRPGGRRSPSAAGTPSGWSPPAARRIRRPATGPARPSCGWAPTRRDAPRDRGVGRHGSGQRRLDVSRPGADEGRSTSVTTFVASCCRSPRTWGRPTAFRAPGVMEGTFMLELALDELADAGASTRSSSAASTMSRAISRPDGRTARRTCWIATTGRPSWPAGPPRRPPLAGRRPRGMGMATQFWWGGGGPPALRRGAGRQGCPRSLVIGMQDLGTGAPPPAR